jgi:hypothetical protein
VYLVKVKKTSPRRRGGRRAKEEREESVYIVIRLVVHVDVPRISNFFRFFLDEQKI